MFFAAIAELPPEVWDDYSFYFLNFVTPFSLYKNQIDEEKVIAN